MAKKTKAKKSDVQNERLPYDEAAEIACLACLMISRTQLHLVRDILDARDFFVEANQIIFEAIYAVWQSSGVDQCSPDLVTAHLKEQGTFDDAGGVLRLGEIIQAMVPPGSHGLFWAEKIRGYSVERDIITSLHAGLRDAYGREGEVDDRLSATIGSLYSTQARKLQTRVSTGSDLADDFLERLDETEEERGRRVQPTGFLDLDQKLNGGMRKGQLIVIAARPGIGKTSFALNIAENVARRGSTAVLYSLEMHEEEIADRMMSSVSRVPLSRIKRDRFLSGDERQRLEDAASDIGQLPIHIVSGGAFSPNDIALQVRALSVARGIDVGMVCVDYLQLMSPNSSQSTRKESRERDIASMSRELKKLSLSMNIPIVVVSQLNRMATEKKEFPKLHHLRESGAIEQDADVVLFLHEVEVKDPPAVPGGEPILRQEHHLIVAKQRNGPTGTFQLSWDRSTTTFRDIAPHEVALQAPHQDNWGF
jgi:replicative DNA helicase